MNNSTKYFLIITFKNEIKVRTYFGVKQTKLDAEVVRLETKGLTCLVYDHINKTENVPTKGKSKFLRDYTT